MGSDLNLPALLILSCLFVAAAATALTLYLAGRQDRARADADRERYREKLERLDAALHRQQEDNPGMEWAQREAWAAVTAVLQDKFGIVDDGSGECLPINHLGVSIGDLVVSKLERLIALGPHPAVIRAIAGLLGTLHKSVEAQEMAMRKWVPGGEIAFNPEGGFTVIQPVALVTPGLPRPSRN